MPYIKSDRREKFEKAIASIAESAECAGDLNYVFSSIIQRFLHEKGLKYAVVNEVVGALECTKLELYRRVAAPYEDVKIAENGDVY